MIIQLSDKLNIPYFISISKSLISKYTINSFICHPFDKYKKKQQKLNKVHNIL